MRRQNKCLKSSSNTEVKKQTSCFLLGSYAKTGSTQKVNPEVAFFFFSFCDNYITFLFVSFFLFSDFFFSVFFVSFYFSLFCLFSFFSVLFLLLFLGVGVGCFSLEFLFEFFLFFLCL